MAGLLHEREGEVAVLDAALDAAARDATPALVLIEGPAGVGKSRLLDAARAGAAARGLRVLAARAIELERAFAFGVARQLVEPLLVGAGEEERARLLAGPAGLAASLLTGAGERSGTDGADGVLAFGEDRRHALAHGLRWVLANAAAEPGPVQSAAAAPAAPGRVAAAPVAPATPAAPSARPLVALVDDAHWADEPSLAFLAALGARLDLPLVLVVALRPGEAGAGEELLDRLRAAPGARVLRPAPLGPDAVARLVEQRLPTAPDPAFADACAVASGGNPFLLTELLEAIVADELAPTAAAAEHVRELVPDAVLRAMLLRLGRLSPDAVALAHAAAILGDRAPLARVAQLANITPASDASAPAAQSANVAPVAAAAAADELAAIHLLAPGEPVRFVHPLVANAVRLDIPEHARALMHGRAAELLSQAGEPAEAVAAQLLHAHPRAWEGAGAALVAGARAALHRGDYAAGRILLARALEEPLAPDDRAEAEIAAAFAEVASGAPGVEPRLDAALLRVQAPRRRAEAYLALALHAYMRTDYAAALATADRGLADLGASSEEAVPLRDLRFAAAALAPGHAADREQIVAASSNAAPVPPESSTSVNDRADRLRVGHGGPTAVSSPIALGVLAAAAATRGATPAQVRALTDRVGLEALDTEPLIGTIAVSFALVALLWSDEVDAAERIVDVALPAARRAGSLTAFGSLSHLRSHVRLRQGRLAEAIADAQQPLELRHDGWDIYRGWTAARMAQAHVERGELDRAEEAIAVGRGGDPDHLDRAFVHEAAADLALAQDDPATALVELLAARDRLAQWDLRHPGAVPWQSGAALAAHRLGDSDRARAFAAAALVEARAVTAPRALARALRAWGTVAGGDAPAPAPGPRSRHPADPALAPASGLPPRASAAPFDEAVALLRPTPMRLELAHALADLGAARRRAGADRDAREPLHEAIELAEACEALPLVQRAHEELRSTGGRRVRRRPDAGPAALTPTERRVAALAADGRTNAQVAAELVVTVKTVEWHLRHAYRKLGIASRAELASALGAR